MRCKGGGILMLMRNGGGLHSEGRTFPVELILGEGNEPALEIVPHAPWHVALDEAAVPAMLGGLEKECPVGGGEARDVVKDFGRMKGVIARAKQERGDADGGEKAN